MKGRVSRRPRLPVPFVVGIFSAIALGLAWGLVYFNLPTPATAPPPSSASLRPVDSDSNLSPQPTLLQGPQPPAQTVVPPSLPVPEAPKARPSLPSVSSAAPAAASPVPTLPALDSPAKGVSPACIVELEKLCEGIESGGARRKCFKDNEAKLSPVCQRQMDQMAARIKEDMQHFRTACSGDVKHLCPDVHPGGGHVLQCLEDNYKDVSENCYQALKHFQKRKAGRSL
jgi:Cysteine rich repeat